MFCYCYGIDTTKWVLALKEIPYFMQILCCAHRILIISLDGNHFFSYETKIPFHLLIYCTDSQVTASTLVQGDSESKITQGL